MWSRQGKALRRQMEEQKLPRGLRVGKVEAAEAEDTAQGSVSVLRQSPRKPTAPHLQETGDRKEKTMAADIYSVLPGCRALCSEISLHSLTAFPQ